MKAKTRALTGTLTVLLALISSVSLQAQTISGELKKWHKVTLEFTGPQTSETGNPNPFSDYALYVTLTNGAESFEVPGFWAADGNAAETSATSGNKWHVHFSPNKTGTWNYSVSFKTGSNAAIDRNGSSAGFMDGTTGSFSIAPTDKTGRDLRGKGRAAYVGEHYLQLQESGEWFVKGGADAPENTFAYDDFDDVPNRAGRRKSWSPHQQDYVASDASAYTWKGGKGTELLGVVNYLSSTGANAMSFLTFSLAGDDENVFPHLLKVPISTYNTYGDAAQWDNGVHHDRFDVSRMAQWERIMEYADKKGLYLHFKTQEQENDQKMDGGGVGRERKLYYRELIARFGHHLALNWNVGEENTNTEAQRKQMADYLWQEDPYRNNVVIHTFPGQKGTVHTPLLGGASNYTGLSLQTSNRTYNEVFSDVDEWVVKSRNAGKKWVVALDEPGTATDGIVDDPADLALVRNKVVWATLLAGGAGVEFYYGYQTSCTDLTCQDHRTRATKYAHVGHAISFFETHFQPYLPNVVESRGVTGATDDYALASPGQAYAIYRPTGGSTGITLPAGSWQVQWFNPRSGVMQGGKTAVGSSIVAPDNNDWVALVTREQTAPYNIPGKIEAEDFIFDSGVTVEPTTDVGGGFNIGFIDDGEVVDYNVEVAETAAYEVRLRVATNTAGGTVTFLFDGQTVGSVDVTNTGGWQVWETVTTVANLDAGPATMRLQFSGGSGGLMNVNWVEFVQLDGVRLSLDLALQGAVSSGSIGVGGNLPSEQPYNVAPWNYDGSETAGDLTGVVDWVLLELRTADGTVVSRRAALLNEDGLVVETDGVNTVFFSGVAAGSYEIVVRHRSHLAVKSRTLVALTP